MKALEANPSEDERADEDTYVRLVSRRIRFYRLQQHLPLERLARDADVSRETLRLIEEGLRMPTLKTLHRIAGALGMTVARLTNEKISKTEAEAETDGGFSEPNGDQGELALSGS